MLGWQNLAIDVVRAVEEVNECVLELMLFDAHTESADLGHYTCTQHILSVDQCSFEKGPCALVASTFQLGIRAALDEFRRTIGT